MSRFKGEFSVCQVKVFGRKIKIILFFNSRHSGTLKRQEMIRKSEENATLLSKLRNEAEENGNKLQLEKLKEKMRLAYGGKVVAKGGSDDFDSEFDDGS